MENKTVKSNHIYFEKFKKIDMLNSGEMMNLIQSYSILNN